MAIQRRKPVGGTASSWKRSLDHRNEREDRAYHAHTALPSCVPEYGSRKEPARRLRETRRRPVRYEESTTPPEAGYESYLSSTDSGEEEDARIERSMGVIRKKTAARGTEGGTKYHCDVCSVDITSTVSKHDSLLDEPTSFTPFVSMHPPCCIAFFAAD